MKLDLIHLKDIAIQAALAAGKIIQQHMDKDISVEKKEGANSQASQVVTEVDRACEKIILAYLMPSCEEYDLALLSEETEDDGGRFEKDYFWCIDPIDGTLPFIEKRPGFSVSIALIKKDGTPLIGVVYDPSTNNLYYAVKDHGAFKNKKSWEIKNTNIYLSYVTDRKLADTPNKEEIEKLLITQVEKQGLEGIKEIDGGGSVINGIRVLENGPACMLKLPKEEKGGGSIWDFAAIACIFQELNLPVSAFGGERLELNQEGGCYMNKGGVYFENFSSK